MKKEATKKLIKSLSDKGAKLIKVKASGNQSPRAYAYRGSRKQFTPDLVAEYDNHQDFYAIEEKFLKKDLPERISKWILFGISARNKGGRFYLVVNKKESEKYKEIINEKSLSAELIAI
jgi:Holliday junction resolvase